MSTAADRVAARLVGAGVIGKQHGLGHQPAR